MTGCALFAGSDATTADLTGVPVRAELSQVPFYPQEEYQCGPAALAMVVSYAGVPRTPEQFVEQVYLPERKGSLQPEMMAATRRAGLVAYRLTPDFPAVLQEISAGHPVLVLQNLLFDLFPRWHYAVVVGYDLASHDVILRSGTMERLVMSQRAFENSWAKAGAWAFVALAPAQLPATAKEDDYVAAVANLERVLPGAAREAYGAALVKWPGDLVARIALGNIAYGAHRLPEAETDYRQATQEHPDSADAWNNLAQVLHDLGHDEEASAAAQRAVAIGGPRQPVYRSTLEAIRSAGSR